MKQLIRDGEVAVLYHPGYGAGWYSWHGVLELDYDPAVVDMVEGDSHELAVNRYLNRTVK